MRLFQRLFLAALLAGLVAGLAMSALQQWRVVPLILAAERFEPADAVQAHPPGAAEHADEADAWVPSAGLERTGYTVLANVLAAIGFALLLGAVALLSGLPLTAASGLLWGLGGFAALQLAPALGLPPELPGMPGADLAARQLWWWGTAIATGAGLLLIARNRSTLAAAVATLLIAAPHLVGAPQPPTADSAVPATLAASFATSTLAIGALFWIALGVTTGWALDRFARADARQPLGAAT